MRLELSNRSDLAIRALRALRDHDGRMKRDELAQLLGTSPDYLARVMGPLVDAGWVVSQTGRTGGYEITEDAAKATVCAVIEAEEGVPIEGVCVLRTGSCDADNPCALHDAWSRARKALIDQLQATLVLDRRVG